MFCPNVIAGGDLAANALLYKQPSVGTMNYIRDNINNVLSRTSNLSDRFISNVNSIYDKFYSSNVINAAKSLLYSAGRHFDQHTIYMVPYDNFTDVNLCMQNYILSHPKINKLYRTNRCYGFQDTYLDPEPDTYGKDRRAYQRVMDGILQFDKNDNAFVEYYSNSDDEELDIMDKISILDTWDNAIRLLCERKDPTDPDLNEL